MSVHVLVAMSFLGHIPNGLKIVVDHINGNTLDNNLKNQYTSLFLALLAY
jgi:hypothetical protein